MRTLKRLGAVIALFVVFAAPLSFAQDKAPHGQAAVAADSGEARLHKKEGDGLVARDEYSGAAGHYLKALELPNDFSAAEKIKMATYISWAGDIDGAIRALREALAQEPGSREARVLLARLLSWQGQLDEAIAGADGLLSEAPGDRDALLIKANSLRWKGQSAAALPIYEGLLKERDDFEVRSGYAFALLDAGDAGKARESFEKLVPIYPAQARDYKNLERALQSADLARRPTLELSASYYNDTDYNQVRRYSLAVGFPLSGMRGELRYRHTDAEDRSRDRNAESFHLSVRGKLTERVGMGAGIGGAFKGNGGFLTGHLNAETDVKGWRTSAGLTRDMLTDTAQLIENGIRVSDLSAASSKAFGRASLKAAFSHRRYSDDNSANDFSITPRYTLRPGNPKLDVAYRFRYLDFDRQSGGGYFDPEGFISHQGLVTLYYEKGGFYSLLEPYYGHQSFERNGISTDDFFWGGYGAVGCRSSSGRAAVELSAEGGDYAVGSAAGFKYYMVGLTLVLTL